MDPTNTPIQPVAPAPEQPYNPTFTNPATTTSYAPAQAPAARRASSHPSIEFAVAIVAVILATWTSSAAIAAAIPLFGGQAISFEPVLSWAIAGLSGFTGLAIVSIAAVALAVLSFVLLGRIAAAGGSRDLHKGTLYAGAGFVALKLTLVLASAIGVAITPLLTLREGMNVGPLYLYQFLPLVITAGLFAATLYFLMKQIGGREVLKQLSLIVLAVAAIALVVSMVAVIIKSHDDKYYGSSSGLTTQTLNGLGGSVDKPATSNTKPAAPAIDEPSTGATKPSTGGSTTKPSTGGSTTKPSTGGSTTKPSTGYGSEKCTELVDSYIAGDITANEYLERYKSACSTN